MTTWAQRQRFEFIRQRLREVGRVTRKDLRDKFTITLQTATATFHRFRELHPGEMVYDGRRKAFVPNDAEAASDRAHVLLGDLCDELEKARAEIARLNALLNAPELHDFAKGVVLEAAHQRERWGAEHDAGKEALDWFWLIGFLAQKAATAELAGDNDKARHHCISTAAAMANWFAALLGADTSMRPGITPPESQGPEFAS